MKGETFCDYSSTSQMALWYRPSDFPFRCFGVCWYVLWNVPWNIMQDMFVFSAFRITRSLETVLQSFSVTHELFHDEVQSSVAYMAKHINPNTYIWWQKLMGAHMLGLQGNGLALSLALQQISVSQEIMALKCIFKVIFRNYWIYGSLILYCKYFNNSLSLKHEAGLIPYSFLLKASALFKPISFILPYIFKTFNCCILSFPPMSL